MDLLLEFKKLGLNVIPCDPNSKKPAIKWLEFQTDRYTGPFKVKQNIAIICGKISNNLVVIDIDAPELINDLFDDFEALKKKTIVVKTGSGGYHIYVKAKHLPSTMRLTNAKGQHIDIQSDKTYVIAPPSIHPNGNPYIIISEKMVIDEIDLDGFIKGLSAFGFDPSQAMKPIVAIAKGVTKGDRNNSLFKYSCHLLDTLEIGKDVAWYELKKCNERNEPPLNESELRLLFKSAVDRVSKAKPHLFQASDKIEVTKMGEISSIDESKNIVFDAWVSAADEHKGITIKATGICPHCKKEHELHSEFSNVREPHCSCRFHPKVIIDESTRQITDARVVLFQQLEEEVKKGTPARFIGRLVGPMALNIHIGQKVRVHGILKLFSDHKSRESEFNIHVEELEDLEEQQDITLTKQEADKLPIDDNWFEKLSLSFAPHIYSNVDLKKILLLTLVGGVKEGKRRGDINLLICGNPSKAKSELLDFANDITYKSSKVNGRHASAAGIAYGMVKMPNGTSVPQAGPLVKNSGGFLFIDELDKMRKDDRFALLEAMEQQTVSLAKAGVNMTVEAKTSVVAACNPKYGTWDNKLGLLDNINLESFLVSRFDIVWGVIESNPVLEQKIAWHIVNEGKPEEPPLFDEIELRKFLNYARATHPILCENAKKVLVDFYVTMQELARNSDESLPLEARQLAGFVRLSVAYAKLHLKSVVEVSDVEVIIDLYKKSLASFGLKISANAQQLDLLGNQKMNREQTLLHAFKLLAEKHEEGHVSKEELMMELAGKTKYFESPIDVSIQFDRLANSGRYIMCAEDGKYRETN